MKYEVISPKQHGTNSYGVINFIIEKGHNFVELR